MYQSIAISHGIINKFCKNYKNWADASGLLSREKEIHVGSDFMVNLRQIISDIPNPQIAPLVQVTFDGILGNIKYADSLLWGLIFNICEFVTLVKTSTFVLLSSSKREELSMEFTSSPILTCAEAKLDIKKNNNNL